MYSASDYRSMARRALKNYWWLAVGVTLLASLLGGTSSSFTPSFSLTVNGDDLTQYYPEALRHALRVFLPVSGIISLAQFVIGGSVSIGHNRFCLKLVDGEQARFEDLFSGFDIFGNAFVLNLLITLKVIAWSLLFVIPGIVAAYRYSMATYIMAENPNMQATEAIERSKALMDGRKGDLFCLDLSFIGWALLAVLTAGIGNLWLTPYMTVSRAAFTAVCRAAWATVLTAGSSRTPARSRAVTGTARTNTYTNTKSCSPTANSKNLTIFWKTDPKTKSIPLALPAAWHGRKTRHRQIARTFSRTGSGHAKKAYGAALWDRALPDGSKLYHVLFDGMTAQLTVLLRCQGRRLRSCSRVTRRATAAWASQQGRHLPSLRTVGTAGAGQNPRARVANRSRSDGKRGLAVVVLRRRRHRRTPRARSPETGQTHPQAGRLAISQPPPAPGSKSWRTALRSTVGKSAAEIAPRLLHAKQQRAPVGNARARGGVKPVVKRLKLCRRRHGAGAQLADEAGIGASPGGRARASTAGNRA